MNTVHLHYHLILHKDLFGLPSWRGGRKFVFQYLRETRIQSLGQEDPLEEEMATHSSILAWKIPWREESDGLQSTRMQSHTRLND